MYTIFVYSILASDYGYQYSSILRVIITTSSTA